MNTENDVFKTTFSLTDIRGAMNSNPLSYMAVCASGMITEDPAFALRLLASATEAVNGKKWSYEYLKSQALLQMGDFDRAAECAAAAHKINPRTNHEIYTLRVSIEGARRNYAEGIRLSREALLYFAGSVPLKTALLNLHFENGDFLQAAQSALLLIGDAENIQNLYDILADSLIEHGRQTNCFAGDAKWREVLARGIAKFPNSFSLNRYFAELHFVNREFEGAARFAENAVRLEPNNPQAHLICAVSLYAAGRYADAVEHYQNLDRIGFKDELFFKTFLACLRELGRQKEYDDLRSRIAEIDTGLLLRVTS
jgi:tetratricopeptide (TPR) repeat protein